MKTLPWPNEYKKLIVDGGEYYEFAHFGWGSMEMQTGGYCVGYKNAADALIENAISSKDNFKLDTFVFPALFLYRQYIELTLKGLIISLSELEKEEQIKKFENYSHDLIRLWEDFVKISSELLNNESDSAQSVVEKYIREFSEIDKNSFAFRYPFTKKLELIFGKERRINLRHIKERMKEIECFFNGTGDYMHDIKNSGE